MYYDDVDAHPEICDAMYKHGESLATYIRRLRTDDVVNSVNTSLIIVNIYIYISFNVLRYSNFLGKTVRYWSDQGVTGY